MEYERYELPDTEPPSAAANPLRRGHRADPAAFAALNLVRAVAVGWMLATR